MNLYHSTTDKNKIIEKNKLRVNTRFDYRKYLIYLLENHFLMQKPRDLRGSYPSSKVQAPFMGRGIYCFDNKEDALSYQSMSQVVHIQYSDEYDLFDLDNELKMVELLRKLETASDHLEDKIINKEALTGWKALLEFLKLCIIEEFEECEPAVGLIFYVINYLLSNDYPDLLAKTFDNQVQADKINNKYYVIINTGKIEKIC